MPCHSVVCGMASQMPPPMRFGYAKHCRRSHDALIRVYDEADNVIETREAQERFHICACAHHQATKPGKEVIFVKTKTCIITILLLAPGRGSFPASVCQDFSYAILRTCKWLQEKKRIEAAEKFSETFAP
jgi:hypothetical protein